MTDQDNSQSSEDDMLHFVRGSIRQKGYVRRRPWVYDLPPPNRRKTLAQFGRIAHDFGTGEFGKRNIVDKNGVEKMVPASAVPVMERMVPVKPAEPVRVATPTQAERLRRMGDVLAAIMEST